MLLIADDDYYDGHADVAAAAADARCRCR